ncbi:MAG: hypothetical protein GX594_16170 [Pirellulaceae bacterium]|nr:hypothetical protein [Pirellulaceae bacterium]
MIRNSDLEAYLDEALPATEMARIEKAARKDPALLKQLADINGCRGAGVHSLGEVWRQRRLSCPPREQLQIYLRGQLDKPRAAYVEFHLAVIGCRYCQANMADLQAQAKPKPDDQHRRRKYFQSSAGYLRNDER